MMHSEEAAARDEEAEATTLESLLNKVKEAVKAKLFWSADPVAANTVHFWASQVAGALKDAQCSEADQQQEQPPQQEQPKSRASLVKSHFPTFLLKILYSNRCYVDLKHFVPVFKQLVDLGCGAPCNLTALENFAGASVITKSQEAASAFTDGDLDARVKFFGSALYADYLDIRARGLLSMAKATKDAAERDEVLKALATVTIADEALQRGATWACTLFGKDVSAETKVSFAFEQDTLERLRFTRSFEAHPKDVRWSDLCFFAAPEDIPSDLPMQSFLDAADLVIAAGCRKREKGS